MLESGGTGAAGGEKKEGRGKIIIAWGDMHMTAFRKMGGWLGTDLRVRGGGLPVDKKMAVDTRLMMMILSCSKMVARGNVRTVVACLYFVFWQSVIRSAEQALTCTKDFGPN